MNAVTSSPNGASSSGGMPSSIKLATLPRRGDRPDEHLFDELLAGLPASFTDDAAAGRWLEAVLRAFVDRLDADRAELFAVRPADGGLQLERSWPPSSGRARVSLDRREDFPWVASRLRAGSAVGLRDGVELPEEAETDLRSCARNAVASFVAMPLRSDDETVGAICLSSDDSRGWSDRALGRLHVVAQAIGAVLVFSRSRRILGDVVAENARLRERLEGESIPRPQVEPERVRRDIVGRSPAILRVLQKIEQVAPTSSSVLLLGETGTGKELVARAIHELSERRERPMVKVNCAALPSSLVESELFGREKGAYTGALSRQAGRFEIADGSTILLDEICEVAPEVQVKLLRVLQEGEFERIGSTRTQRANVRVIAATNRDLAKEVRAGRFREDLYYRLNVFPIRVPPLRERREDVPLLVWAFVQEFARSMGRPIERIGRRTMDALQACPWPGNIRELRNVVERAMILNQGSTLDIDPPEVEACDAPSNLTLEEVERRHIRSVLEMTAWRVRGRTGAAEILGMKPTTLESRLERLGVRRPGAVAACA